MTQLQRSMCAKKNGEQPFDGKHRDKLYITSAIHECPDCDKKTQC